MKDRRARAQKGARSRRNVEIAVPEVIEDMVVVLGSLRELRGRKVSAAAFQQIEPDGRVTPEPRFAKVVDLEMTRQFGLSLKRILADRRGAGRRRRQHR